MNQIKPMKRRLALRIFSGHLVTVLLVVIVIGLFCASWYNRALKEKAESQLLALARVISLMPTGDIMKKASSLTQMSQCEIAVIDPAGRVILDTDPPAAKTDNYYDHPEIRAARIKGHGISTRYSEKSQQDVIYVAVAIGAGEKPGYVRLSKPLAELQAAASRLYKTILQLTLLVLIPALLLSGLFFWRLFAPLRAIEAHTRRVMENGRLTALMIDSDDELGGISRNINSMIQFQQQKISQLQEEKGKIEAIFASLMDGVIVTGADNRIESHNNSMLNIIEPNSGDIIGKTPIEVLRSASLQDALTRFQQTGEPVTREITVGADGEKILEISIAAIKDLPGRDRKTLLVFHDVTRLRRLERIRADFVASLTHELKTPLTALVGFSETLLREMPAKEIRDGFLKKINDNSLRLNRLVDDLLIISSIEQGEAKLEPGEFSLCEIVAETLPLLEDQIQRKGLLVENKISPALSLWADRDGAFRIFLNVIGNAVKFTPAGGKVEITAGQDERGYLAVRITDTGIGIPEGEIPRLGERFYRVDKTRSRELGGSGLGLSIVKHLLNLHRGWLKIESRVGSGTSVSLYFPGREAA